jgi:hypothetical protein
MAVAWWVLGAGVLCRVNLSQRMTILPHVVVHGIGLLMEFRSTAVRCRHVSSPSALPACHHAHTVA